MFLALYLHPVKYNAEKRIKNMPPHLHCIVCRCCLGSVYPQLDVSCRCLLCLDNKQMFRLPILGISRPGIVSAPPPPLSLHHPACCPRVPAPCHTSHVTLRHTSHMSRSPEGGGALTLLSVPLGPPSDQALGLAAGLLAPHHVTHYVSRPSWSQ